MPFLSNDQVAHLEQPAVGLRRRDLEGEEDSLGGFDERSLLSRVERGRGDDFLDDVHAVNFCGMGCRGRKNKFVKVRQSLVSGAPTHGLRGHRLEPDRSATRRAW